MPKRLLLTLLESDIKFKFGLYKDVADSDMTIIKEKLNSLIKRHENEVLLRGIFRSRTKKILVAKLNSDDSLYDGLFLVGDKAKNFLEKSQDIPHPIKRISSLGSETASWIFKEYRLLTKGPIELSFFQENKNEQQFVNAIIGNESLIDYYLFGLHTQHSARLVNFVSTTLNPKTALYNQTVDKLIIFLWIPTDYTLYINGKKLRGMKDLVESKKLPILHDSFYPEEEEFSFKGFILPHLILGVHDVEANEFIFNPAIKREKTNWIDEGFDVDQSNFESFIKQTKYQRFLRLTDRLVEKDVV